MSKIVDEWAIVKLKMNINKIVDEWAKKHKWDYDCYKEQIDDLKEMLKKKDDNKS